MKDDESEGDDQVEEEPHIYHLDVGRGGEILTNLNILGDGWTSLLHCKGYIVLTLTKRVTMTSMVVRLMAMTLSKYSSL